MTTLIARGMWFGAVAAVLLPTVAFSEINLAPDFPIGDNAEKAKGSVSSELVAAYRADVQPTVAEKKPTACRSVASTEN